MPPSSTKTKKPPSREPHICVKCNKVFSRKEYVRRHMKTKSACQEVQRSYTCVECDLSFATNDLLDQHYAEDHALDPDFALQLSPSDEPVPLHPVLKPKPTPHRRAGASADSTSKSRRPARGARLGGRPSSPGFDDDGISSSSGGSPILLPTTLPLQVAPTVGSSTDSSSFSPPTLFGRASPPGSPAAMGSYLFPPAYPIANLGLNLPTGPFYSQLHTETPGSDFPGKVGEFYMRVPAMLGPPEWGDRDGGFGNLSVVGSSSHDEAESARTFFFGPSQRFCMGYKSPWQVPPLPKLSHYASLAVSFLLPCLPVIHRPTLFETPLTPQFAFALAATGAGYEGDARDFHDEMMHSQRHFAIYRLPELHLTAHEDFSMIATLILYNFVGLFHQNPGQRTYSGASHVALVQTFKRHDLVQKILQSSWVVPSADCTLEEMQRSWREWIQIETWKKLTFLVFMLDLEHLNNFHSASELLPSELAIDLPASYLLWNASSAREWHSLLHQPGPAATQPPSFLALLDAVLCLEWPAGATPVGSSNTTRLVPQLGDMDALALCVLGQMLIRIERQLVERLEAESVQGSPSQAGTEAVEGLEVRDPPDIALIRVRNGQQLLSAMTSSSSSTGTGWQAKGAWFKGLQPIFA